MSLEGRDDGEWVQVAAEAFWIFRGQLRDSLCVWVQGVAV